MLHIENDRGEMESIGYISEEGLTEPLEKHDTEIPVQTTETTATFTMTKHDPRLFELLFGACPWPKPDWWGNDEDDLHS